MNTAMKGFEFPELETSAKSGGHKRSTSLAEDPMSSLFADLLQSMVVSNATVHSQAGHANDGKAKRPEHERQNVSPTNTVKGSQRTSLAGLNQPQAGTSSAKVESLPVGPKGIPSAESVRGGAPQARPVTLPEASGTPLLPSMSRHPGHRVNEPIPNGQTADPLATDTGSPFTPSLESAVQHRKVEMETMARLAPQNAVQRHVATPAWPESMPASAGKAGPREAIPAGVMQQLWTAKTSVTSSHSQTSLADKPSNSAHGPASTRGTADTGSVPNWPAPYVTVVSVKPNAAPISEHTVPVQTATLSMTDPNPQQALSGLMIRQVQTGQDVVKVQLHPEGMGSILISVSKHDDGGVQLQVTANQMSTMQWLSTQVNQIADAVRTSGVELAGVQVQFGQANLGYSSGAGGQSSKRQRQEAQSHSASIGATQAAGTWSPTQDVLDWRNNAISIQV